MKHQVLFSLKNNEKIFVNVVCCSRDWRFKGLPFLTSGLVHLYHLDEFIFGFRGFCSAVFSINFCKQLV